jgi:hypothetical protein
MSRTLAADLAFGRAQESLVLPRIRSHFNDTIEAEGGSFTRNDFFGQRYKYELKSRTCAYADYPTTLLPADKVFEENHIFLFNFTNGLYYITYNKEKFDTFEKKVFQRRRRADHYDVPKPYYYIPIAELTKID